MSENEQMRRLLAIFQGKRSDGVESRGADDFSTRLPLPRNTFGQAASAV